MFRKMSSLSTKLRNFVLEPMGDKDISEIAGIGPAYASRLRELGFDKASTLLGMFLILKKDQDKFLDWLDDVAGVKKNVHGKYVYKCLDDWCSSFL